VNNHLVTVRNLVKHFPLSSRVVLTAVNDVSFSIAPGETLGLVGESGSGKTTVGRCLLRLIEPSSGEIAYRADSIAHLSQSAFRSYRPKLQAVFQDPFDSLDPRLTIGDTILESIALWNRDASKAQQHAKLLHLAELVKLRADQLNRYPRELSGGQQQRVGIARALATDPEFIVLDEPTSSLDPLARAEIIELLIQLQKDLGLSYLFISHDLMTVRYVAQRVAVMYLGHIVEIGTTLSVFSSPRHPYTQALLSAVLIADPAARGKIHLLSGEIPSPVNLPPICPFVSRCPVAIDRCFSEAPRLADVVPQHAVACFRAEATGGEFVDWFEEPAGRIA
jgi:oligopeptide/dipeptide ABC transporter ATP-binding protein